MVTFLIFVFNSSVTSLFKASVLSSTCILDLILDEINYQLDRFKNAVIRWKPNNIVICSLWNFVVNRFFFEIVTF